VHNRLPIAVIMLCAVIFLSGCGEQNILERLGFTHSVTFDQLPDKTDMDNKLLIGISVPRYESMGKGSNREFLSTVAESGKEGKQKLSRQTEFKLVSGQMRNVFWGQDLAKNGVWDQLNAFLNDSTISPRVKVSVVSGSAHDLLMKDFPPHSRTGQYIDRMLEKESNSQTVVNVNLFEFTRDYWDDGIDPITPLIKDNGKEVVIDGIALFDDDRYVARVPPELALILTCLRGNVSQGDLKVKLSGLSHSDEPAILGSIKSKRSVKVTASNPASPLAVTLTIKIKGFIQEYNGDLNTDADKDRKKAERHIERYIEQEAEKIIKTMKKHNADSIGLGKYIRNSMSYDQWKNLNWKEAYTDLKINLNVKVNIVGGGKFLN